MGPQVTLLPDGRRLHLQHGPIDLVIEAWGDTAEVMAAYRQAAACFQSVLSDLVAELPLLRRGLDAGGTPPQAAGVVARRMIAACAPYRSVFITPMAAVAGAVADHVLQALLDGRDISKVYVNNGGDIAVFMGEGQQLDCGLVTDLAMPQLAGILHLTWDMRVGGVATSGAPSKGRGGRSFSLGIADTVTVLARDAAMADAAATIIANEVDLPDHAGIGRQPASLLDPDSDLGDRLVTVAVPPLAAAEIAAALAHGQAKAEELYRAGLIAGAILALQGEMRFCGTMLQPRLAA